MLFIKSEHFLLLPALLLVFSIFSFTHGASQYHQPPSTPVQDMRDGDEYGAVSWGVRRYLVEGANAEAAQNPSMILAAERTHRRDILENFRYYKGGWDIRQKHYLSSAGITGAPLFLIAAIWFLGFGLCFFIIGLNYCCCYRRHRGYSPTAYAFSLIFLTLFTVAAMRLALIIIATVMLLLALLGFLFSVFSLKFLVHTSVTMGWILVTVTFILCGIFLIFHNVMADTCVAMDQWLQNPTAHTALDDMLPCLDNATTQETLYESKDVTFQLVNNVNQFIINGPNSPRNELNYNQSGPMVPVVCNPFHSDMTDRKCVDGEVDLNNAAQEWKKYVCQVSETGNCTSVGQLTPAFYSQMVAIVDVSYALYHHGPFLVDIQDCTFVRETFNDIIDDHCPGLKHYSKFICIGLAMVSAAVMLSLILWVFNARERQHHVYKQFIASPPMSL